MYYLHDIGAEPTSGVSYATKQDALEARQDGQTVTRVVTPEEAQSWRSREQGRFDDGTYTAVPWDEMIEAWSAGDYGQSQYVLARTMYNHYAHVSLAYPGMIAYTPDDTFGAEDRQLRVKPGKYLKQFASKLWSATQIELYAGQVKAVTGELLLARTPDDIARVYCAADGPTSCMDGRNFNFNDTPVRAYGDSDLAVAYLGSLDAGGKHSADTIAARCVVWPENKVYGRAYGDTSTLYAALELHGYTAGSMHGAKVRAIEVDDNRYLMPYTDCVDSASLKGKWFVLGSGEYDTRNTEGFTRDRESGNMCAHCNEECGYDETYCYSCRESAYTCDACEETYFDDDARCFDQGTLCGSCAFTYSHNCENCGDTFNDYDFRRTDRRTRNNDLCGHCHDDYTRCSECDDYTENSDLNVRGLCTDCRPVQPNCVAPRPRGTVLRHHTVSELYRAPAVVCAEIRFGYNETKTVLVNYQFGAFIIHRSATEGETGWNVTHRATGLAAISGVPSKQQAQAILHALENASGVNWAFDNADHITLDTRSAAMRITREARQSWVA